MQSAGQKQSQQKGRAPSAGSHSRAANNGAAKASNSLFHLHHALGNQAAQRMLASAEPLESSSGRTVTLPLRGFEHPVAASMRKPGTRFRVPEFGDVKSAYTDKNLKIPEAVIKSRVTELLQRMEKEGRLKSKESVADIVKKIFPAPGVIDEVEFNNAIDVSDRKKIYKDVTEADTKVKPADQAKLKAAMKEAAELIKTVEGNATGLKQVFGSKDADAKANYDKAQKALDKVVKNMDLHVTTDYNLDDPEVGLGGFANFDSQKMHLLLKVAQVEDLKKTKATVIHEASHLANPSVDDQVYYAKPGFFEATEDKKIANAAHYEELPRREMGTSSFDGKTFTPGVMPSGKKETREDTVKAAADLYLRKAWDAGVDAHILIRGVRREIQKGNTKPFNDNKALLLEMSKLMDLTIHEQAAGKETVTVLDVSISESVSRGVRLVGQEASKVPFPSEVEKKKEVQPVLHTPWYTGIPLLGTLLTWIFGGPEMRMGTVEVSRNLTDDELRDQIVMAAVAKYGNLLKDKKRDKALLDWLEAHYRSLPGV